MAGQTVIGGYFVLLTIESQDWVLYGHIDSA